MTADIETGNLQGTVKGSPMVDDETENLMLEPPATRSQPATPSIHSSHVAASSSIEGEGEGTNPTTLAKCRPSLRHSPSPIAPMTNSGTQGNPLNVKFDFEDVTKVERRKLEAQRKGFLAMLTAEREFASGPSQHRLVPTPIISNYVADQRVVNDLWEQRVQSLRPFITLDYRLLAGIEELQKFWQEQKPRWDALLKLVNNAEFSAEDTKCTEMELREYEWAKDIHEWIQSAIEDLENVADIAKENLVGERHRLATGTLEEWRVRSGYIRGSSATSNTAAREWMKRRKGRKFAPSNLHKRERYEEAHSEAFGMSSAASYRTNFTTLGAVAFFGASVAWGHVFAGDRGDLVLSAWAAAAFVSAAVAAGGMGIIVDSGGINMDRDIVARRFVRAFAICSAIFILAGIIMLSIAMAMVDPDLSSASNVISTANRRRGMRAAGWFTVAMVLIEVGIAIGVRIIYSTTTYHL